MPEVFFRVRWPDGSVQRCTSPSTAIEQLLAPGATYPVAEFHRRATVGLELASERVRARYGMRCTAAAQQAEAIGQVARTYEDDATVHVEHMRRGAPPVRFPAPDVLEGHHEAIVIGAGQAGLAASYCLRQQGVEHVVLERDRIASTWRNERWDAFCLVTPNWQCRLPGFPYSGDDPDGFMLRDEVVEYVAAYARAFDAPVLEGVNVSRVSKPAATFVVETDRGTLTADQVVLCVGGYHVPSYPDLGLPTAVTQLHSSRYRTADALPDGAVLVVGSGQSGAQIAEDLHRAGREVHLAVGSAPRVSRSHRGRDVVAWLEDMGHYDVGVDAHPEGTAVRKEANHYVTGRDGGKDIDLRAFGAAGMHLHGRLLGHEDGTLSFSGDLVANLDAADATLNRINAQIDAWIAANGVDAPPAEPYVPTWSPPDDGTTPLDTSSISTVIWATGFRSSWGWVDVEGFLDAAGYPDHDRGVLSVPGLYVLGLPWLHTWGSGRFAGIARDAEHVAAAVSAHRAAKGAASLRVA